ncbi:MAG: MEDS domain-containing protein [Pseudolabrys sp.]
MPQTLQSSGIPFLDDVPWGSHLCVFYETQDDLIEAAGRFFEQGLDNNELCVWALPVPGGDAAATRLSEQVADLDRHLAEGRMRFVTQADWYPQEDAASLADTLWSDLFDEALRNDRAGVRASGASAPLMSGDGDGAAHYDAVIAQRFAGRPALALTTYDLTASSGADVLDIARVHGLTVARRRGEWQPFETPAWNPAAALEDALAAMASSIPGYELLTERERGVLGFLLRGASSKEVARDLGISPRTADFHRANIIEKLGARNTADVVRRVLIRR